MTKDTDRQDFNRFSLSLEGRLLAHRSLLVELMQRLPTDRIDELMEWMEDRTLLHDGQEDPAAVPSAGVELELARADEFRMLSRLAKAKGR
jgi:hypothetical protein